MEVEELPLTELQENLEDEYCHIRHAGCPSLFALCGAFKPYSHSPGQTAPLGSWKVGELCQGCGKELCSVCIQIVRDCPQCGGR